MNAIKHTPGPWKAVSAAACAEVECMEIAEVANMRVIPAAGGWPTPGAPEDDARLIAASPELLEFAKEWLSRQGSDDNYMTAKARAVIAKAEGQS